MSVDKCAEMFKGACEYKDGNMVYTRKSVIETIAPPTELLMKVFRIFDKHGLIRDDLCFDPEHFMETVVRVHWNDEE